MKTDVISVSSKGKQIEAALTQVEKVAAYNEMDRKSALHLRLLTEEMMGMMRSITGETEGQFWIEDEDGVYQLHLKIQNRLSSEKREKLISVSSSGKNESAKGLMGRLRDFFDVCADDDSATYPGPLILPDMYEYSTASSLEWEWSMAQYQEELSGRIKQNDADAIEAWDELEKSVVSHVADDIKVYVHGRTAEMVILKKLA